MPEPVRFEAFRPEEFRLYESRNRGDESLNEKRLAVRHKLQAIGERARGELAALDLRLERRESLHHPFSINHNRVVAQWTSIFRDAKQRKEFAKMVGPELGKDVDPGNANVAFFVSIDEQSLQIGLRLGESAWYDAQNLTNRRARNAEQERVFIDIARSAPGFFFRIHDWETLYPTEKFSRDHTDEIFKYYKIGEHRLTCVRMIKKDDPAACSPAFADSAVAALLSLAPIYKYIAWSTENNYLIKGGGFA